MVRGEEVMFNYKSNFITNGLPIIGGVLIVWGLAWFVATLMGW